MITQLAYILTSFSLQLVVAELMFCTFLKRRSYFPFRLVGCLIPFVLLTYDIPFFALGSISLRFIFTALASVLLMWFCFDAKFSTTLFCCISGYAVRGLGMNLYVLTEVWRGQIFDEKYDPVFYLIFPVLYVICYLAFARKLKQRKAIDFSDRRVLLVALAIIVTDQLCGIWQWVYNLPLNSVCPLYGVLCCLMILCIQYLLYVEDQLRQENRLMAQLFQKERERFALSKNNVGLLEQQQQVLRHTVDTLRNNKKSDSDVAVKLEHIANNQAVPCTGNRAIDIAVTEKRAFCAAEQIGFTYMVDGQVLSFMAEDDLYALLNRILTGALDCERRVAEAEKRFIALKIFAVAGCAYIHVDSYCEQSPKFENGIPVFADDAGENGKIEMQSIRYLVEKYDGLLKFSQKESRLCADFLFPEKVDS